MNSDVLREVVALSLVPQLGARRIRSLMHAAGSARAVFAMGFGELCRVPGIGEGTARAIADFSDWAAVDRVLAEGERLEARLLGSDEPDYPSLLKEIADPPVLLWCRGDIAPLSMPAVAVIGTRKPSDYGHRVATRLSRELCEAGLCVVSGLAHGIDAAAHEAALQAGGRTVGVLGSGIDRIYPGENRSLARRMLASGGCVISEFPPGTKPDAGNFPVRNRVVSGLCLGTLVVETTGEGGSMITARLAVEQNREVFAVPHRIGDLRGDGCNHMIQLGGAKLVRSVGDILEELGGEFAASNVPGPQQAELVFTPAAPAWRQAGLEGLALQICERLAQGSLHVDDLAAHCGQPVHLLLNELLGLEFRGLIRTQPGKYVQIVG